MISNPDHSHNDWYEELCALAAAGELSASEVRDLNQHLEGCKSCSELFADFRRLTAEDISLVIVEKTSDIPKENVEFLHEQKILSRLLSRASREHDHHREASVGGALPEATRQLHSRVPWLVGRLRIATLVYGAAALVLVIGLVIVAYRTRTRPEALATNSRVDDQLRKWKTIAQDAREERAITAERLQQSESDRRTLEISLAQAKANAVSLAVRQSALERALADAQSQREQLNRDLGASRSEFAQKARLVEELESRLQDADQRVNEEQATVEGLREKLRSAEQEAKVETSVDNSEVKTLLGARDLHIVDVYDVESSGKTRRTYGRVYYVENKLLVFYAFDLQDRKRNRAAAGFQAWGDSHANSKQPENLGLFYVDDATTNRWALKVSDPGILQRIDTVFATLEPPGGSRSPRGQKLLYANLAGPPNHP